MGLGKHLANVLIFLALIQKSVQKQSSQDPEIQISSRQPRIEVLEREDVFENDREYSHLLRLPENPNPDYKNPGHGRLEIIGSCYKNSFLIAVYPAKTKCPTGTNDDYSRYPLYFVCFNNDTLISYYSYGYIRGGLLPPANAPQGDRPNFSRAETLFAYDFKNAYSRKRTENQMKLTFGPQLWETYFGRQRRDGKYYDLNFFSVGHLFPSGDAYSKFTRNATFFYINAAPQWQAVNGGDGNWEKLEKEVQRVARDNRMLLTVWTGTFGQLALPNQNGEMIDLYLQETFHADRTIPVPKFYWKVVHNFLTNYAIAFVQVNNPHVSNLSGENLICDPMSATGEDLCDTIPWLNLPPSVRLKTPRNGYLYCCEFNDFKKAVEFAPDLADTQMNMFF